MATACAILLSLSLAGSALADSGRTYYFVLDQVKLPDDAPEQLVKQVRAEFRRAVAKNPRLMAALPDEAPDPKSDSKGFLAYVARHKLHPYKVRVEVGAYDSTVEKMPEPRRGNWLKVTVSLRVLGVTMAKSTFGFTGEGSTTIKAEVGKKVRKRDRKFTTHDAIEQVVADALNMSIERLDRKFAKARKKRKVRKKKRSRKRKRKR